jgi:branched-chain amino acid transport system permease protein
VFGLAMALSLAIVAVAGVLLAVRANFDPAIGRRGSSSASRR